MTLRGAGVRDSRRRKFSKIDFSSGIFSANGAWQRRQQFLPINVLRWREIFLMIETSNSDVDLIGAFVVIVLIWTTGAPTR
jgi:hypothetical protein